MKNRIYKLRKNYSDVFEGFNDLADSYLSLTGRKNEEGEMLDRSFDFARFRVPKKNYKIPSLKRKWDRPEMVGHVAPFNDFPCCGFIPVFSMKAVAVLGDFLNENGELLPVKTDHGSYFAYQTLTVVDGIVNIKKCKDLSLSYEQISGIYSDIGKLAFYSSKIPNNLSIFRLREFPSSRPFVSQQFVDRALSNGLQGFGFEQVLPALTVAERRAERAAVDKVKVKLDGKLVDPQKHAMKIVFPFDSSTKNEHKKFERIARELQHRLILDSPDDNFFGAIQSAHSDNGQGEIYISTPNGDRLKEHMEEFIESVKWSTTPIIEIKKKPFWQAYKPEFS